jgi:hypothetical protein
MSKKPKNTMAEQLEAVKPNNDATHSPKAVGAHFASVQASIGGELIKTLKACIIAYTTAHKAEYAEMVEGYGEQAKSLYDANTAKTRKSEFKKVVDHASADETRQNLVNIIDGYDSVQRLVKDLRALESGKALVNDEGKVEKVKAEKQEGDSEEGNSEVTADESKPLQFDLSKKEGLIEALEMIMIATHASGFTKAADLIMQAQASIGRGE